MNMPGLCARDLMQADVKTVTEKTSLRDAARMMHEGGVSSLVVERKDESDAFGIITRKDVVEGLVSIEIDDRALLVEDVMAKPAITVPPDLSITHCLQMMRMAGVRRIPVVDAEGLVGILSNTDVFKHLATNIDRPGETVA